MAARSLFIGISLAAALAMAGCAAQPKTCYVTLSVGGQPTAEACETGPVLIVRPITETNAAFYVPPYVLGALSYEGFVAPPESTADGDATADDGSVGYQDIRADEGGSAPNAASALRNALIGDAFLMPLSGDPVIPTMSDAFVPPMPSRPLATLAKTGASAASADDEGRLARVPLAAAPSNRIAPEHRRIDGEVRYQRPYEGIPGAPISPDFL